MEIPVIEFLIYLFLFFYNSFRALTNDLIERKTRALEGGLNKLKFNTQRDQTKSTYVYFNQSIINYYYLLYSTDTYRRNGNKEIPEYVRDKPTGI